jgi:nucleotide-binding universal stress UspA family protein
MIPIKKILVPFDFSENGRQAIDRALPLALQYDADLFLLTVIEHSPDDEVLKLIVLPKDVEYRLSQKVHEEIQAMIPEASRPKIRFEARAEKGKASLQILLTAEREKVDLIVMGTQGRTGLKQVLLGSVAEKVVRRAGVPVWISRGTSATLPKKILIPIDFSDYSREALQQGVQWAKDWNAELLLLHVVDLRDLYAFDLLSMEGKPSLEGELEKQAEERLKGWSKNLPISHQIRVTLGSPVDGITETAKKEGIDLILMATHGHTGLKHLVIGSVAEQVVRYSSCSVMTLRPPSLVQSTSKILDGDKDFEDYMKSIKS